MKITESSDTPYKLRKYREANALSQRQVADALHIERSTYTKYETGTSEPGLLILAKIAKIFNVSPEMLMPTVSEIEPSQADIRDTFVDRPIYQLSRDERSLVAFFRVMDKEQRGEILEQMSNITKNSAE